MSRSASSGGRGRKRSSRPASESVACDISQRTKRPVVFRPWGLRSRRHTVAPRLDYNGGYGERLARATGAGGAARGGDGTALRGSSRACGKARLRGRGPGNLLRRLDGAPDERGDALASYAACRCKRRGPGVGGGEGAARPRVHGRQDPVLPRNLGGSETPLRAGT